MHKIKLLKKWCAMILMVGVMVSCGDKADNDELDSSQVIIVGKWQNCRYSGNKPYCYEGWQFNPDGTAFNFEFWPGNDGETPEFDKAEVRYTFSENVLTVHYSDQDESRTIPVSFLGKYMTLYDDETYEKVTSFVWE